VTLRELDTQLGCTHSVDISSSVLRSLNCSHNRNLFSLIEEQAKSKAIPVRSHEGPYGCVTLRFPHFLENRLTDGGDVVSLSRRPRFTPLLVLISVRGRIDPRAIVRLEGK
jgi:hypothetical protein